MRFVRGMAPVAAAALLWHFFYAQPLPWPDEATFADPAVTLLQHGRLGTPSMAMFLPGIDQHTYWVWPFYLVALAGVFKLFGASLVVMRLFTIATAAGVWALASSLGTRIVDRRVAAWLPSALLLALIIDARFLRAALVGRMDMLVVLLILGTIAAAARPGRARGLVAGLMAGLAMTTHPLGIAAAAALAVMQWRDRSARPAAERWCAIAGLAFPLAVWAWYIAQDPAAFLDQFRIQLAQKRMYTDRLHILLTIVGGTAATRVAEGLWLLTGLVGAAAAPRSLVRDGMLGATVVLVPLVVGSAEMWYLVYLLPFAALGMAVLAGRAPRAAAVVAVLFALSNGATLATHARTAARQDYPALVAAVRVCVIDRLPAGSTVLFDSIPDLHIGLIDQNARLRLMQSASEPVGDLPYQRARQAADVIVVADRTTDGWHPGGVDTATWQHMQVRAGGFAVDAWWPPGRVPLTPGACSR